MTNLWLKALVLSLLIFPQLSAAQFLPLTDPQNTGNWIINEDISDEFDSGTLNEAKWQIQGKNGVYKSNFIGRQPSQFSPNNAIVENGKLKIQSKWEPDFPFDSACRTEGGVTRCFENITTAAVISKKQFQYGYMEIKSKAAKAEVTSSFWTTGFQSELDMFEMFGDPKSPTNSNWKKRLKFNMISWNPNSPYYLPDGNGPAHTRNIQADNNTADDFHVYGFEWTSEYIKVYIDGVLHPNGTILRSELGEDRWVTNVPYWIWFDSETFWWLGLPEEEDFNTPVEYEIEYIRIWEHKNLIDTDFFGFESSINIEGTSGNWYIPSSAANTTSISTDKPYRWANSLKFTHTGALTENALAFAPYGALDLTPGEHVLSLKVWLESGSTLTNFQVVLENPFQILNFDVSSIETGKWITLTHNFNRISASGNDDRLRIRILPTAATTGQSSMYLDDIFINSNSALSIKDINTTKTESKIFPNPINSSLEKSVQISAPYAEMITLYNLTGTKLKEIKKTTEPMPVEVSNLKSGIYFLNIQSTLKSETKKLIIN